MKKRLISLVTAFLLSLLLAACLQGENTELAVIESEDSTTAIFSSDDLQQAEKIVEGEIQTIEGTDLNNKVIDIELPYNPVEDVESELTTQGVLPNVVGFLVYIRHRGDRWQIYRYDQSTNTRLKVLESNDKISSVAISLDGNIILATILMPSIGNYEVYRLNVSDNSIKQITNTNVDESDVSITANGLLMVWGGKYRGVESIHFCKYIGNTCPVINILNHSSPQIQPSITGEGSYIALIRELANGRKRILLFNRTTGRYIVVYTDKQNLADPSASDNGLKVMYSLHRDDGRNFIKIKDLANNTITTERNTRSKLEHAHMNAKGELFTYGMQINGFIRLLTRNIATNAQATGSSGVWDHLGMYWQSASSFSPTHKSCLEILDSNQSQGDGIYQIDVDGAGSLEPFEVYCDMTTENGGWTLYANHSEGLDVKSIEKVDPTVKGVLQAPRWLVLRDQMTTGMMFLDENDKVATISASKLNTGNCVPLGDVDDLTNLPGNGNIWHNENFGCLGITGVRSDYSLVFLTSRHSGYDTALYQFSFLKFDKWPYQGSSSAGEQFTRLYFIK